MEGFFAFDKETGLYHGSSGIFIDLCMIMNRISASLREIVIAGQPLQLYVPDPMTVRRYYEDQPPERAYWSQIWPAAIGLCEFIAEYSYLVRDKKVIELAAGLGLPSLLASRYSRTVLMSDYLPEAVELMQRTIGHQGITNLHCGLLDWNNIPLAEKADVMLLSDVNYDPAVFENVFAVIVRFLSEGSTIILSTPQRLMAKPFIERLLPFRQQQEEIIVERNGSQIPVSILVLRK